MVNVLCILVMSLGNDVQGTSVCDIVNIVLFGWSYIRHAWHISVWTAHISVVTKTQFDHILIIPAWHDPISVVDRQVLESFHPLDGILQVCHRGKECQICTWASGTRWVSCLFLSNEEFKQWVLLLKEVIFLILSCGSQTQPFMSGNKNLENEDVLYCFKCTLYTVTEPFWSSFGMVFMSCMDDCYHWEFKAETD